MRRILWCLALKMEDLPHGASIPVNLSTASLDLPPTPLGHKLSRVNMAPFLVHLDILPPILLCIALRLKGQRPGETIPVKLSVLLKLHPTPLGPKPWLGPPPAALAVPATRDLRPEIV